MRIRFHTQYFDPEPGYSRGLPLARALAARGHDIHVITGFPHYPGGKVYPGYRIRLCQREVLDGIPVTRVPVYPSHDSSAARRIACYASMAASQLVMSPFVLPGSDVTFAGSPPSLCLAPMAARALNGRPYVFHVSDLWPDSVVDSGMISGMRAKILERTITAWCSMVYKYSAGVTVLSPGFKRVLVERGVPASRVHVVYNWTEADVFRPMERDLELARSLGLEGKFVALYAGNLGAFQGVDTIIRAAALLRHDPRLRVVIAGTGLREGELKDLARQLQLTNVVFVPRQDYKDMPRYNALADVQLVHLRDLPFMAVTIPGKTQVSLATGRPVLMAVRGDAADLVRRSGAGLTCDPDHPEAMAACLAEFLAMPPERLIDLGKNGRAFYESELSLERATDSMERIFADCANGRLGGQACSRVSGSAS